MALTDWKNGITHTEDGHDMLLPTDDYVGQYQMRHYVFLRIPLNTSEGTGISGGGIGSRDITRMFKYQLWEGDTVVFETEIEITFNLTFMAAGGFGATLLSFASWAIKREVIKTTIVNGEPTDPVVVINTQSTSGRIQDYDGNDIPPEEADKLENPSWKYTQFGTRTGEFGNLILDFNLGMGTNEAILDGRYEAPIYFISVGPETQLDIVTDSMQAAGRADLYQFRFGGARAVDEIKAGMDGFGCLGMPVLQSGGKVLLRSGGPPYITLDNRALVEGLKQPCFNADGQHRLWLSGLDNEAGVYEERLSLNDGHIFEKLPDGLGEIWKGRVTMPYEIVIDEHTNERGAIAWEGNALTFKSSRDGWASKITIAHFQKPELMALSAGDDGVLYVGNGAGYQFVSENGGVNWRETSVVVREGPVS